MLCSWIALLAVFDPHLPVIVYGTVVLMAGLMALFLPETSQYALPNSAEDCEEIPLSNIANCSRGKAQHTGTADSEGDF